MENLEPLIILAGFTVVVTAVLVYFGLKAERALPSESFGDRRLGNRPIDWRSSSGDAEVWSQVALRLGAELLTTGQRHRVRFNWQGRDAMIFEGDPVRFEVSGTDLGGVRGELLLGSSAGRPLGGSLDHVSLRKGDEAELRAFLTPPVGQLLRDLLGTGANGVVFEDGVHITARLRRDPAAVLRFSVVCLKLAQHVKMLGVETSGIRVLESVSSSTGECQTCGSALEGKLVRCARCSTPHHADCWEYTGACSTYGCGEKRVAG